MQSTHLTSACFSIVLTVALFGPRSAIAQYSVGAAPTIDPNTSLTVFTVPANRTRTDIGIGEQVDCFVAFTTWVDSDDGPDGPVYDGMGSVTWTVTGQGTVTPMTGNSTKLTAKKDAGSAVVTATIDDAAGFANDAAIQNQLTFTVKVPVGIEILDCTDGNYGAAGTNSMGAKGEFKVQITPNTVNFKNAEFTEDVAEQEIVFPSGDTYTFEAFGPPDATFSVHDDGTDPNITEDNIGSGTVDPDFLIDATTMVAIDANLEVLFPNKFKKQDGTWSPSFETEEHGCDFRASDHKARVYDDGNNTVYGDNWMGPWNAAPYYH